uniref:Putative secreted protein n=1 Tax=Anopheles darlingi TaxID=43151 RepID=A0A2M4DCX2_ANODA
MGSGSRRIFFFFFSALGYCSCIYPPIYAAAHRGFARESERERESNEATPSSARERSPTMVRFPWGHGEGWRIYGTAVKVFYGSGSDVFTAQIHKHSRRTPFAISAPRLHQAKRARARSYLST